MHIPSCFFYTETQSKVKYDSIPTGAPNIDRLLAGLPPFPTPTPAREEKQKKLVLSDWTMPAWSQEKIKSLGQILTELQDQGFSLYRWNDGKVSSLERQDITDLINKLPADATKKQAGRHGRPGRHGRRDMEDDEEAFVQKPLSITSTEEVRLASVMQQGIPQDQIQILDDYWLNHLMSDAEKPGPRVLRISEIPELTAENLDAFVKLMKSAIPKLEKIIFDKFTIWPDITTSLLINAFPADDTLAIEIPEDIKELSLRNGQFSSENLTGILQSAPQAESIDLFSYNRQLKAPDEPLALEVGSLPNLKHLNLEQATISLESLINLLEAAPNLESLNIRGCYHLQGESLIDINLLQRLEKITVGTHAGLSSKNMQILASAPNIIKESKEDIDGWYDHRERFPHRFEASSSQVEAPPINPTHNPEQFRDFKSPSDTFKFTGMNKTKNQGMIIEKFSQYLTNEDKHLAVIPIIQEGICLALSNYFKDTEKTTWDDFINKALAWNGKKDKLDDALIDHFETLYAYVERYYLKPQVRPEEKEMFLGDNFLPWVTQKSGSIVLKNPWHAIAIKPIEEGRFQVYDPNYVTGYLEVEHNDLASVVHDAIGSLISVQTNEQVLDLYFNNANAFIEEGGMLVLVGCSNANEILAQLPAPEIPFYSKEALDGLFLRSLSTKPAWLHCIESNNERLRQFTLGLLEQFKANNDDFIEQLLKSIDALSAAQKGEAITKIVRFFPGGLDANEALISRIQESANKMNYEKSLETWNKSATAVSSSMEYVQHCLTAEQKRLIELNSTQELDSLRVQLETQACHSNQAIFYIDNPEDLICSAPYVEKQHNNSGILRKGPGGPLFDFLHANYGNNPLIIVNYERFNVDDMVRFNGLLDKHPNADGTPLPPNTRIIGLMNRNKPDCYQGSDFYSRFEKAEICPLSSPVLSALRPKRSIELRHEKLSEKITVINLFHAADWKERLLGRWILDGDKLTYAEGELVKAIHAGKSIEIQNGLWQDADFQRFWQQALSSGIQHGGLRIQIPKHLSIIRPEIDAYNWDDLKSPLKNIYTGLSLHANSTTLNPGCLAKFLERYELDGKRLIRTPGFLEQCALDNKTSCIVNMTRNLNEDELAILFTEAKYWGIALDIHCAPGVTMPAIFAFNINTEINLPPVIGIPPNIEPNSVIHSTDTDTTLAMLSKQSKASIEVIDVSECNASDLLFRLDGGLNDAEPPCFEFSQRDCAVKNGLAAGKTICLKGRFSQALLDELAPLILERERCHAVGNLILITQEEKDALFVTHQFKHTVQAEEKCACLNFDEDIIASVEPFLATESFSQLKARCTFLQSHPAKSSDNAWLGMERLPRIPSILASSLDRTTTAQESKNYTQTRIDQVNAVLGQEPYVFLTGLSGVGKSTFVEKDLCQEDSLHLSEAHILDWVNDASPKRKILFLDEANLSPRQWSEFEGLYNKPASILVNGVLYPLSDQHKVVFAGNPVHYGDERTLAPFFKRHGNAVLFDPLTPAVIYEKILKPIFDGIEDKLDPSSEAILAMYTFVCSCSETDILISPRELEMMALLTRSRMMQHPDLDSREVAAHFIYELAKNLVPVARRDEFDEQFKPPNTLFFPIFTPEKEGSFLITPSRQAVSQQLDDLLGLRELRRHPEYKLNDKQKFGGLGGIIIEGEPGIGKSELVIASLVSRGYEEEHDFEHPSLKTNPFYRMPVSMSLTEKENLLIKAFNEGAVVMIDEINSSPMMERLLNDLLMGKNPRNTSLNPEKPGFMVIGTQNPITMAGRRAPSTALQRRLITTTLPEYTSSEIHSILCSKGIAVNEAELMIEIYESKRNQAIHDNLSPIPNFRNLMTLAENHLRGIEYLKTRKAFTEKPLLKKADTPNIASSKPNDRINYSIKHKQTLVEIKKSSSDLKNGSPSNSM
jgi:hypothetical protein